MIWKVVKMEPHDVKLGRIAELKDSPFFNESPVRRSLADLIQREAAEKERSDRLEALLTKMLAELVEIKAILLSMRDSVVESDVDKSA